MAAVTDSEIFMNRLADHSSIFTAEAKGISLALDHIKKDKQQKLFNFLRPTVMSASSSAGFTHKPLGS